jgi:hypothetical protein
MDPSKTALRAGPEINSNLGISAIKSGSRLAIRCSVSSKQMADNSRHLPNSTATGSPIGQSFSSPDQTRHLGNRAKHYEAAVDNGNSNDVGLHIWLRAQFGIPSFKPCGPADMVRHRQINGNNTG